jgi:NAD(P)-dependent dehydrogenase (short-subunit alcohol dehydrogenase family)
MTVRELFEIKGRVALVTGGSRGLGLQIAQALGEMGARVAISARKAGELEVAKLQLAKQGIDALTVINDLTKPDQVPALVEAVAERYGRIDILVNNAGTSWGAPAEDYPLEAWNKVMNLNATSVFALSQAVRQHHCHRIRRRAARGREYEGCGLLRVEGGGLASHPRVGRRMGAARRSRQCHLPRIFPV